MAAKDVRFSDDARSRMFKGVNILANAVKVTLDRKSTRLNSSHSDRSRMPSSA